MGGTRGRSRAAIADAASRLFAERGYAGTSVREIARAAEADPALVIRHFGSKESLFLATMQLDDTEQLRFDGPLDSLGENVVRYILEAGDRVRGVYLALLRASDTGEVGSTLRVVHEETFVLPLRDVLDGADRDVRARLIAAMVGGLMYALWVVDDTALAGSAPEHLARAYGAAMQRLITPNE